MTTTPRRRRLIEVAFPLEEVSAHSAHDKNVKQGHINMLHIWWARRPLAACRAFIYATLVDDPNSVAEREALLREVADLASWDTVRHPEDVVRTEKDGGSGLTGRQLLERARQRILECNDGRPPNLLALCRWRRYRLGSPALGLRGGSQRPQPRGLCSF